MKKILITINNDALSFSYKYTSEIVSKELLNTNVISNREVVFSDNYIKENKKIVSSFIKELYVDNNIKKIIIEDNEMADIIIDCLKKIDSIDNIYFQQNTNLTYSICEKMINNNNIKSINCYGLQNFIIDVLDKAGIKVDSRCEILFSGDFMLENNLTSYSKMYYKMNLRISTPMSKTDIDDFTAFVKINKYLKNIHIDKCDISTINMLVNILYQNRTKNIHIYIHDNISDERIIETLRKINKKYSAKYKITLSLKYDEKYIKDNYLKQVAFTTLKLCSVLTFMIIGCVIGYIVLNNKTSERNVTMINEEIETILSNVPIEENIEEEKTLKNSSHYINSLLSMNSDTIGWLKVNNTKVDYPVVQTNDNDYYLKRNYNKKKDYNGWIFMDYRNNPNDLDKNTIIYGHNIYYTDLMFSSLSTVQKKEWRDNEENMYITFNTLNEDMTFKIFSIYGIKVTSDYLQKDFDDTEEWMNFVDMISKRSDYQFDTEVTKDDKILTLSTCLQNNRRLVIHAVLVK